MASIQWIMSCLVPIHNERHGVKILAYTSATLIIIKWLYMIVPLALCVYTWIWLCNKISTLFFFHKLMIPSVTQLYFLFISEFLMAYHSIFKFSFYWPWTIHFLTSKQSKLRWNVGQCFSGAFSSLSLYFVVCRTRERSDHGRVTARD